MEDKYLMLPRGIQIKEKDFVDIVFEDRKERSLNNFPIKSSYSFGVRFKHQGKEDKIIFYDFKSEEERNEVADKLIEELKDKGIINEE